MSKIKKGWKLLGKGSYNTAYVSADRSEVLKVRHNEQDDTDAPERSIRIWKEINPIPPGPPPPPYIYGFKDKNDYKVGWVCPFIEGEQASDNEISKSLIQIFNNSGRIVVDAAANKNFVKTPQGQIVCVDIGMAFQMEKREEALFEKSLTSLNAWKDLHIGYREWFISAEKRGFPNTVKTVKALLFIKANRPDIINVSFLTTTSISTLAKAYDMQAQSKDVQKAISFLDTPHKSNNQEHKIIKEEGFDVLNKKRPIDLESLKASCRHELMRYINSRGSLSPQGEFQPSFWTWLFKNEMLTKQKVSAAQVLISNIDKAKSPEALMEAINVIKKSKVGMTRISLWTSSDFRTSLGRCMTMVDNALHNPEVTPQKPKPSHQLG